ncbi:hypothetical protein NLI96_g6596 [Meripilus lineatus]|uniref:Uncharacterized protein n=1 Tax=Meripilus lineatus TaxID=2056292 RepID=A0AAD5V5G9_9APHY|nr:hypothetical protein NLI96_g6596 [Physisporinus lineatus]
MVIPGIHGHISCPALVFMAKLTAASHSGYPQRRERGPYQSHYMLEVYSSSHFLKIRGSFLDQLDVRDAQGQSRSPPYGAIELAAYAETSINIWNGHVSNLALDIGKADFKDFAAAIAGYHPQTHIGPPPSASLRYAPRIVGKGAATSSEEEGDQSIDDDLE